MIIAALTFMGGYLTNSNGQDIAALEKQVYSTTDTKPQNSGTSTPATSIPGDG